MWQNHHLLAKRLYANYRGDYFSDFNGIVPTSKPPLAGEFRAGWSAVTLSLMCWGIHGESLQTVKVFAKR